MFPPRLEIGGQAVAEGRWQALGGAVSFGRFRNRVWLGGAVHVSSDGSVTVISEPGVGRFAEGVLRTLQQLRERSWGDSVAEVVLLEAHRSDYGSGRSLPGQLVLELGSGLGSARLEALVRHEVAHQLVGGGVRFVRDGAEVGWFLEGFAEYLGFAMVRDEPMGRAALLGRFAEACGAVAASAVEPSEYDLGFLYAAAVDGALWRARGVTLEQRLRAMLPHGGGGVVFGEQTDFVGTEPRADFISALLDGSDAADHAALRDLLERRRRPIVQALARNLGVTLGSERIPWRGLPLAMHERRDGLFNVTQAPPAPHQTPDGVAAGDVLWPLSEWSGPGLGDSVPVEVGRTFGWKRLQLPTVRGWQTRFRVLSADDVSRRWFPVASAGAADE